MPYKQYIDNNLVAEVTSAGERTEILQPAFSAYLASDDVNQTGNGTFYTVGTDVGFTEIFDQNSDFNTNGTFTSPVTGRYQLNALISISDCTTVTQMQIHLTTSNRLWPIWFTRASSGNRIELPLSVLTDMDAADTAIVSVSASGEGADTCDIFGDSNPWTGFSGNLEC